MKLFKTRSILVEINRGAKDNGEKEKQWKKGGKAAFFAGKAEGRRGREAKRKGESETCQRRGESPKGRNSRYSKARGFTLHKFYVLEGALN